MTSEYIYEMLKSRAKTSGMDITLKRYAELITSFRSQTIGHEVYTESHHILPKADDAFPELSKNPDNIVVVTARQHYILHRLLFRGFGGSQVAAFMAMLHKGRRNNSSKAVEKYMVPSSIYASMREKWALQASKRMRGKATYVDEKGNHMFLRTDDERVLSGLYKSTTLGRSSGTRSEEWKRKQSERLKNVKRNKNKKIFIYFLDVRIEVLLYGDDLIHFLDQGWSMKCTPEFRSRVSTEANLSRTKEFYKDVGKKISSSLKGKKYKPRDRSVYVANALHRRTSDNPEDYMIEVYSETEGFSLVDRLTEFDKKIHTRVFVRPDNGYVVYPVDGGRHRYVDEKVPLPSGYSIHPPNKKFMVYNTKNMIVEEVTGRDINKHHMILKTPNSDRIKVSFNNRNICIPKSLVENFGMPKNCTLI